MDVETQQFRAGYAAHARGEKIGDNPHTKFTYSWREWQDGWIARWFEVYGA